MDENEATERARASIHSSRSGDFLDREPVFDSGGSSDSESDLGAEKPSRQPVSVVWQNLTVVRSFFVFCMCTAFGPPVL